MNDLPTFFIEINWKEFRQQHPDKGIVIHGPQGSGKTTMAKQIAKDSNGHWIYGVIEPPKKFDWYLNGRMRRKVVILDGIIDDSPLQFAEYIASKDALFIFCIQGDPGALLSGPFIFIDTLTNVVTMGEEVKNG